MNSEELIYRRVQRVLSAGWLSFTDLCFHCGFGETEMRDLTKRKDFPRPAAPTESTKGRRWSKAAVNEWMESHSQPVSDA